MATAAILLAAGESRRMGRPKPLLPWADSTLIEYQVRQLQEAAADPVIVVTGHAAKDVASLASRAGATVVHNGRYADGRATSVIAGAEAVPSNAAGVLILNVDEPRPAWLLRRLLEEHTSSAALITRPTHNGERGHPPVLDASLIPELLTVREETLGIRDIMDRHAADIRFVEFDTPIVTLGINTPDEYKAALQVIDLRT